MYSAESMTDWRRGQNADEEAQLLKLFADDPHAPLSIHRFVEHGAQACGKYPGQWFGPSATAKCIEYFPSHPSTTVALLVHDLEN